MQATTAAPGASVTLLPSQLVTRSRAARTTNAAASTFITGRSQRLNLPACATASSGTSFSGVPFMAVLGQRPQSSSS